MIYLFTDFGWSGPYVGEMKAVLMREQAQIDIVDLMHDAPSFNPRASAYLLAALSRRFVPGDVCLAVVDPGVGSPERRAIMLELGGIRYVGPDNGLFAIVQRRSYMSVCQEILWRPELCSDTFHGRDLFAPVVSRWQRGEAVAAADISPDSLVGAELPEQLAEVIYIDNYGNAVTGMSAEHFSPSANLILANQLIPHARTFADVEDGEVFWYANSMGLVEIAVNCASAADRFGLSIGFKLEVSA